MAYLFQPKHILLISKIIINFVLPEKTKLKLVKSFDQYFFEDNPMYNRNKFFVALNWIRVLCREIKKASVNLEKTKLQWKSRGF